MTAIIQCYGSTFFKLLLLFFHYSPLLVIMWNGGWGCVDGGVFFCRNFKGFADRTKSHTLLSSITHKYTQANNSSPGTALCEIVRKLIHGSTFLLPSLSFSKQITTVKTWQTDPRSDLRGLTVRRNSYRDSHARAALLQSACPGDSEARVLTNKRLL